MLYVLGACLLELFVDPESDFQASRFPLQRLMPAHEASAIRGFRFNRWRWRYWWEGKYLAFVDEGNWLRLGEYAVSHWHILRSIQTVVVGKNWTS